MTAHPLPTRAEIDSYLRDRNNWGRWVTRGQPVR